MALSKFTKTDGTGAYTLTEYSSVPGGRADLLTPLDVEVFAVVHKRNNVIIERSIIETKAWWNLFFKNISQTMVENLRTLSYESKLHFYPDASNPVYYVVYWLSKFRPKYQRGGTYNLSITLIQR
jgi:hypothetical protein